MNEVIALKGRVGYAQSERDDARKKLAATNDKAKDDLIKQLQSDFAEEEKECDEWKTRAEANDAKLLDMTGECATAKADLKGTERLLGFAEEQIKRLQEEKAAMEATFAKALQDIKEMAEVMSRKQDVPDYILEVTGRDGNNDLRRIKLVADKTQETQ